MSFSSIGLLPHYVYYVVPPGAFFASQSQSLIVSLLYEWLCQLCHAQIWSSLFATLPAPCISGELKKFKPWSLCTQNIQILDTNTYDFRDPHQHSNYKSADVRLSCSGGEFDRFLLYATLCPKRDVDIVILILINEWVIFGFL